MERVQLGDTLGLSRIVYGMWRLGNDCDTSPGHIQAKIEACLAQGITTLDQADTYGGYKAEGLLGEALKAAPHLKDKIEIVTKCGIIAPVGRHASASLQHYDTRVGHIQSSVEASLREMAIDRIDLLLIHRPDPMMDHFDTGQALDALVASGKVGHVGVSNFRPWDFTLLQSAMETRLVTNQIEMSLSHHVSFTNGDLAFLQEHDIKPMAWSPLGGGVLVGTDRTNTKLRAEMAAQAAAAGVEESAIAVAWLLAHPATILPVMGTNKLSRIKKLSEAMSVEMDRQAWYRLYEAALGHKVA